MRSTVYCVLCTLYCLPSLAQPFTVPVDGQPFAAKLVEVDAKWQITLRAGKETKTLAAEDLVSWGACAEATRGPIVVLADGGLVVADVTGADKDGLAAESELLGAIKLPLDTLAGIVFHVPAERQDRDKLLDRVIRATGRTDRLMLDNGDEVSGLIEGIQNDKVQIKAEVGPVEVEVRRIVAAIFNPALRHVERNSFRSVDGGNGINSVLRLAAANGTVPLRVWVGLTDGTRLPAARLVVAGSAAEITTTFGQTWKTAAKEVVFLLPLGGRVAYLSDCKPAEYRHLPYLDLSWPWQADRNVTGGLLRSAGRLYLKGLGVHSAARLSYDLEKMDGLGNPSYKTPYRRFQAELGIDDSTGGRGSVGFRVFLDGQLKFSSGPVRGGAAPVPVSVDLSGAKRLDLVVDYGERGDELDHADWLGARFVK